MMIIIIIIIRQNKRIISLLIVHSSEITTSISGFCCSRIRVETGNIISTRMHNISRSCSVYLYVIIYYRPISMSNKKTLKHEKNVVWTTNFINKQITPQLLAIWCLFNYCVMTLTVCASKRHFFGIFHCHSAVLYGNWGNHFSYIIAKQWAVIGGKRLSSNVLRGKLSNWNSCKTSLM